MPPDGRVGAAGLLPERFVTWVNVSGKQISAGGIESSSTATLARAGLAPAGSGSRSPRRRSSLEGAAGDRARGELEDLHALGVRIAIDDFGTGFSSLGHLRRFPVDVIKVDRSFVQGVEHDAKDAAITANLASLAHALGVVAIAEGIESRGPARRRAQARLRPRTGLPVRAADARRRPRPSAERRGRRRRGERVSYNLLRGTTRARRSTCQGFSASIRASG